MKILFNEYGRFIVALIAACVVVPIYTTLGDAFRLHSVNFICMITGVEYQDAEYIGDSE